MAAAGTSTIIPSGGRRWGSPPAASEAIASSRSARVAASSSGMVTIGTMISTRPIRGGAGERAQLRAEEWPVLQREPHAAQAEERVRLAVLGDTGNRLVAAGVEGADGDGPACRPFGNAPVMRRLAPPRRAARGRRRGVPCARGRCRRRRRGRGRRVRRRSAMLRWTAIGVPSAVTRGLEPVIRPRRQQSPAAVIWSAPELVEIAFASGPMRTRPFAPSTIASDALPGGAGRSPTPTTIGTPRPRASTATWLVGLPSARTMAPPVQSVARKREGVEIVGEDDGARRDRPSVRLRQARRAHGRAYPSRSAARARKYSSSAAS